MDDQKSRPNAGLIAMMSVLFLLLTLFVGLTPRTGEDFAVLVPADMPAATGAAIVHRSGGSFLNAAWQGRILIARSDDPRFMSKLYANGALFVFSPRVVAGCRG